MHCLVTFLSALKTIGVIKPDSALTATLISTLWCLKTKVLRPFVSEVIIFSKRHQTWWCRYKMSLASWAFFTSSGIQYIIWGKWMKEYCKNNYLYQWAHAQVLRNSDQSEVHNLFSLFTSYCLIKSVIQKELASGTFLQANAQALSTKSFTDSL